MSHARRAALVLAIATACDRPGPPPEPPPPAPPSIATVRATIESILQHYKVYTLNGDALGLASLFTPDGHLELPGLTALTGKRVIAESLRTAFRTVRYTAWAPAITRAGALGMDSASAEGTLHEVTETSGRPRQRWLSWTVVYLREPDGQYRIASLTAVEDSAR